MNKDIDRLIRETKRRYGKFGDWIFEYMYPGYFMYFHAQDDSLHVYFTPDFEKKDVVAIQVMHDGKDLDVTDVPFTVRTVDNLFAAVKPWLEKYKDRPKKK